MQSTHIEPIAGICTSCERCWYDALPVRRSTAKRPYSTMLNVAVQSSCENVNLVPYLVVHGARRELGAAAVGRDGQLVGVDRRRPHRQRRACRCRRSRRHRVDGDVVDRPAERRRRRRAALERHALQDEAVGGLVSRSLVTANTVRVDHAHRARAGDRPEHLGRRARRRIERRHLLARDVGDDNRARLQVDRHIGGEALEHEHPGHAAVEPIISDRVRRRHRAPGHTDRRSCRR